MLSLPTKINIWKCQKNKREGSKIKGKCQKSAFPPGKSTSIYWATKWWIGNGVLNRCKRIWVYTECSVWYTNLNTNWECWSGTFHSYCDQNFSQTEFQILLVMVRWWIQYQPPISHQSGQKHPIDYSYCQRPTCD